MKIKSFIVLAALSAIVYVALAAGYRQATLFDYRVGAVEYAGTRTNFGGTIPADTDHDASTNGYYNKARVIPAQTFGLTVGWMVNADTNYITVSGADSNAVNGNYDLDVANVWTNKIDGGIYYGGGFFEITNGNDEIIYTNAGTDITGTWYVGETSAETVPTSALAYYGHSSNVLFTLQKSFDGSNWVAFTNFTEASIPVEAITNHSFVGVGDTLLGYGYVRCSGIYNSNIVPITNLYMHLWSKEDF